MFYECLELSNIYSWIFGTITDFGLVQTFRVRDSWSDLSLGFRHLEILSKTSLPSCIVVLTTKCHLTSGNNMKAFAVF
jgi:hypothetical protein